MSALYPLIAVIAAYLIGSLSFAVIVSRVMGLNDPRTYGSGNPGATNVLRSGSKAAAAVTLLLDALKGLVPVVLVKAFGAEFGLGESTVALVALAAFLGHLYPVFFAFKGGKGWPPRWACCWHQRLAGSGHGIDLAHRGGVLSAIHRWQLWWLRFFAPVYYVLCSGIVWDAETPITVAIVVMAALLLWRHRENIQRLIACKESKLGQKKADAAKADAAAISVGKKAGKSKRR